MLKYNVIEGNGGKVIVVKADDLMRYALHDENNIPLTFKRAGKSDAVAVSTGKVLIYKKPSGHELHREYMLHNGRSLWLGFRPHFDTLAENLYTYEGSI